MWRLATKFLSMRPSMMALVIEAFVLLGWARVLKALPFAKVAPRLGLRMAETPLRRDRTTEAAIIDIARAIKLASRHTPWESSCMVTAVAGMKMLQRRKIESTIYMGTGRDESGRMNAHAWLRSGAIYLTGAEGIEKYAVVATFGKSYPEQELRRSMTNG